MTPIDSPRDRRLFDQDWVFYRGDAPGAQEPAFDVSGWQPVELPHDWSIEGPFAEDAPAGGGGAYLPGGIGWYRKAFTLPALNPAERATIEFDGVYKNSDVWLNGHHLGFHPYGYTSFQYDLTPYLQADGQPNVLAVRVDNSKQPDTRWYTGSGICRHVWLTRTRDLHIAHWGAYVTTPLVSAEVARVTVATRVQNEGAATRVATLATSIIDADGQVLLMEEQARGIDAGRTVEFYQRMHLMNPILWSLEQPYLYTLRSVVKEGEQVVDTYETPFGIRKIEFHVDRGFLLNDRPVKINGVCLHRDGGCVGAAAPERVWERRLALLKEMGCNAIRTSHYPPAPEFLDLCDRMGFVVMDEAFDEWKQGKFVYGYHEYFDEWAIADVTSMVHRDRNHPSIVLWSVGNEIPEQTRPEGVAILKQLVDLVHREDPTRPVTSACDNISAPSSTTLPFLELLDVVGYNYVDRWGEHRELYYSLDRRLFPQRKMIGSENVSVGGIRGEYLLSGTGWRGAYNARMIRAEQLWKFTRLHDYVAGDFMWTGIDYLGEARWPHKNASSGPIDLCGFPKDGFYFYQSQWTSRPMLHVFPHWNWAGHEGQVIPVLCYTNCDEVELFLNGRSLGVKRYAFPRPGMTGLAWSWQGEFAGQPTTADLHLTWDVPYEPGTLRAEGRKGGQVVCVQEIVTAGAPAVIELTADRETITADGRDVAHLTVRVLDAQRNLVPTADALIAFKLEGEGRIIGVDNGNPESHESFQARERKAFNGLCLVIVQATRQPDAVRVTASSAGLQAAMVTLSTASPK